MKTIITSSGSKLTSEFDLRFGRCPWFCVFNDDSGSVDFIQNTHAEAPGGAGTKASQEMVELGANRVISGDFGPKAKEMLDRFDIQMIILPESQKTISEIIDSLKRNKF